LPRRKPWRHAAIVDDDLVPSGAQLVSYMGTEKSGATDHTCLTHDVA
jgi:hypothetical protein